MLVLTLIAQHLDFRSVILEHDEQLTVFFNEWMDRFQRDSDMTGEYFPPISCLENEPLTRA